MFCVSPLATVRIPLDPVSELPMASMITRFGKSSRYWSFTVGEKIAAVEARTKSDDRSRASGPPSSSRASIIGRAMASPVMLRLLMASRSTVRHTSCGSNLRRKTTTLPSNANRKKPHCAAPCMSGGRLSDRRGLSTVLAFSANDHSDSTRSLV